MTGRLEDCIGLKRNIYVIYGTEREFVRSWYNWLIRSLDVKKAKNNYELKAAIQERRLAPKNLSYIWDKN